MLGPEEGALAGERVPVVDFGIAKATTDGAAATWPQTAGYSPSCMRLRSSAERALEVLR